MNGRTIKSKQEKRIKRNDQKERKKRKNIQWQQAFRLTSLSVDSPNRGVLTSPGWMHVIRTPLSASSDLMACDKPSTKNLVPE